MKLCIQHRKQKLVNVDGKRRCYNGCFVGWELFWESWEDLQDVTEENYEETLLGWRELNDYAVSQRGESARKEFRVVNEEGVVIT